MVLLRTPPTNAEFLTWGNYTIYFQKRKKILSINHPRFDRAFDGLQNLEGFF